MDRGAGPSTEKNMKEISARGAHSQTISLPESDAASTGSRIESPLVSACSMQPDKTAIVDKRQRYSYGDLFSLAAGLADRIEDAGLGTGDRVGIYLEKSIDAVIALYGTWLAGTIAVPINESLKTPQVGHILENSGARLLVTTSSKLARLEQASLPDVSFMEPDGDRKDPPVCPRRDLPGGAEPAAILYTSGSTGRPKGILISHDNLLAGARIVSTYLESSSDDRLISIPPFSFDYGLNQLLTSIGNAATLVLQRSHFPADICRTLVDERITGMAAVPPLWVQLAQDRSPFFSTRFECLRYMTSTGGVFPTELVRRYREHLPDTRIFLMYGLSEAFRSTYLPPDQAELRPASMGRAIPETEIFVLNEQGEECAPGEAGELVHSGPTVALGYWQEPELTRRVFRPHPFVRGEGATVVYSGDLVKRDEEGFLYFVARRDRMIKSYGYRISPDEVEEILMASDQVIEAIAYGVPDEVAGAVVIAHVVPADTSCFDEARLLAYCRRTMPSYMVPTELRIEREFPRTATGKIDRERVRR